MESGAFNSPNYPDPYPANVECVWTVKSSPGNRLQLSFMSVSLNIDASDLKVFIKFLKVPFEGKYHGFSVSSCRQAPSCPLV